MTNAPHSHTVERKRLSLGVKFSYAMGGMVDAVVSNSLATFLLFYVTSIAGLSGGLAGIALAAGTIVDAVLDPLIGSRSDNQRSRLGRRLPFMLIGLPLVAAGIFLTFALPRGLSEPLLFAWVLTLSIVLRTALSVFGIPYQAVAAEITEDPGERSTLVGWRWGLGLIGGLAAVLIGFNVFFKGENGLSNAAAYPAFGLTLAAMLLVAGLFSARAVHRTLDRQHAAPAGGEGGLTVFREVGEVFRNPSFRALAGTGLLLLSALAVNGGLAIHAGTYFWRLSPSQLQLLPLTTLVGLLLGAPFAAPLTKWLGKRNVALIGLIALVGAYGVPPTLKVAGLLPLDTNGILILLSAIGLFVGALMSAAVVATMSMMADATDEHEHIFGTRREGLFFAAWLFASKAASGVGIFVAGLILQFVNFPKGASHADVATIDPASLTTFGLLYALIPGALVLGGVIAMANYRLTANKHAALLAELHVRRGERVQVDPPTHP